MKLMSLIGLLLMAIALQIMRIEMAVIGIAVTEIALTATLIFLNAGLSLNNQLRVTFGIFTMLLKAQSRVILCLKSL